MYSDVACKPLYRTNGISTRTQSAGSENRLVPQAKLLSNPAEVVWTWIFDKCLKSKCRPCLQRWQSLRPVMASGRFIHTIARFATQTAFVMSYILHSVVWKVKCAGEARKLFEYAFGRHCPAEDFRCGSIHRWYSLWLDVEDVDQ